MGVKECIENGLRDWNELLNSKNRISISKLILKYGVSDRVALVAKVGIEQAHQKLYTQT